MGKVNVYNYSGLASEQFEELRDLLFNLQGNQDVNFQEIQAKLEAMMAQNDKAHAEHQARFDELAAAIAAAGQSTPEVDAAMAALEASIQRDDDVHTDAEAPPPPPPPEEPGEPTDPSA